MEWSWIPSTAAAVLNAVALAVWKPWAQAYSGEKGKNLARKEDLDKILAEVRAVTATQKEIEAKISGELWNRQMVWNQKRDLYAELFTVAVNLRRAYSDAETAVRYSTNANIGQHNDLYSDLRRHASMAQIFANAECNHALDEYFRRRKLPDQFTPDWFRKEASSLLLLNNQLIVAARADLGMTPSNDL